MDKLKAFGAATAALFMSSTLTFAEVCDKIRPDWSSENGPVSQFDDAILLATSGAGVTFLTFVVVSLLSRSRAMCLLAAIASATLALLLAFDWLNTAPGSVQQMAIEEGCSVPPYLAISVFLAIFTSCVLVGCRCSLPRLRNL
jgi:hypothetical protein